ncbi:hypothetical protein FACS189442_6050 [Spirochaetia bacterium]|nr:hypothetical protein FACS189442_6050 [Spirochaetia bacterium]
MDLLESLRIPELAAKLDTAADPLAEIADIIDIPDFDLSGLDL